MREPGTILVVDDNVENRALARDVLQDEGYRVVVSKSGHEAVAAVAGESIDCVLLDVRMPDLDGFAACAQIRALPAGADVPIVFVTAQCDVETFDRAVRAGGDDFVTKPYRPTELVARVEAALKLRRLANERNELYEHVKRQRDDLRRLQLQKERLISFLVHDLKNPVNSIELAAELAVRDPDATERLRRSVARIRDENRSLLRMITNLLDLAKSDEAGLVANIERIELEPLAMDVATSLQARADAVGVRIVPSISADQVYGDRALLRRVLENLIDNALRYAPEGTQVHVVATAGVDGVELRVVDAGTGVPPRFRDRVFERYAQVELEAGRANHGLGLAFCKLVVEAHGGRIWIEDASPGAAFCMWLAAPTRPVP